MARAVLTTGANSGIGLATVLELARRGYRSIGSVRSETKAETMLVAAAEAGVTIEPVVLDVTDADACVRVMSDLELYGLVNNAGLVAVGAVEDIGDDEARLLLETMVVAPMRLARLALPSMRHRREGRIVNVSSMHGLLTTPLLGWYQAAKHALEAVSDALRTEVAGAGVRVVLIEPGGVKTAIPAKMRRTLEELSGSRYARAYGRASHLARLVEPSLPAPARCAAAIADVLDARLPRARYIVGRDTQMSILASRLTPTAVKDVVFRVSLGL